MSGDPVRTRRESMMTVATELDAAGFENAAEVGRGGFGVVYRCTQEPLDRTVAVKLLTAESDEDNRARFAREQRAMGRLTGHPNIVTVLEEGITARGRPYLVTPFYPLGSLDAWIRHHGPLSAEDVLQIGAKIAGALESAHRLGVVHRDVKPGNILLTDYGEPALTDFGIAHIAGGFRTAAGTATGSPAFTAPEVLEGEPPTPGADIYGLGATMFCALTGHAAFERRSGEKMVTQFLRITTQPLPDLRESGVAADISDLVESAMNRDSRERPSAATLAEIIGQMQERHGYPVDGIALQERAAREEREDKPRIPAQRKPIRPGDTGNLPLELTSMVNRRTEVAEVKNLLATSRLVTLTGTGGVGKTRLALRVAAQVTRDFADGVWLADLTDVSERTILVDVVAEAVGVRDETGRPLIDVLVEHLCPRETLLVLDNCEQLVDAVAELDEVLLQGCRGLRILATSREPLNIAGETALRVAPLAVPDPSREPTLLGLPRFDAVTLFAERAAAAVPGFELDEDNKGAVAQICARLDGLPLAIELAAARLRTMTPQQILERLDIRNPVLTRSSRTAPTRQRTLRLCMDWSYDLCSPAEQQLWAQLSVFAGSCELDAAEGVCVVDPGPHSVLDVLSSLVDKSILIREESGTVVRFRMLETLRDYGRQALRAAGRAGELRRRHHEWYERLCADAAVGWIGEEQAAWIARLAREQPNLRDALEYCLTEDTETAADAGVRTAAGLYEFWNFRGLYGEGRSWLERVLARPGWHSVPHRIEALCAAGKLAATHGEFSASATALAEARDLAGPDAVPASRAQIAYLEGLLVLSRGESGTAPAHFERVVDLTGPAPAGQLRLSALTLLGWAHELSGDTDRASEYYREVLAITEPRREVLHRAAALRGVAVAAWRDGDRTRARQLMEEALRVNSGLNSTVINMFCLESLAWIVDMRADAERAAVLMGAAQGLWPAGARVMTVFHNMAGFHDESERDARAALGERRYEAAHQRGRTMGMDAAVAYALGESADGASGVAADRALKLTKRERQVADLVARGLSNKQIATKLVISQRTSQGHVENILTKLGFTSRTQIAAWVVENSQR
ncbi:protein kinase domain-containing protein [Nocardia sp. NBC_01329]|uniref:protein kinase domain-containing protein n=1 Tax=Nocardia sp. NBC_01329 TaxID=2903594 RepID=UPI002E13DD78|nr:protein kinase [Nocardia sp. NBC_01329]